MHNPQLNKNGELAHLLSIEGLPKAILTEILDIAVHPDAGALAAA